MIDFSAVPFTHPAKLAGLVVFGALYIRCLLYAWRTWRRNPWPAAGMLFLLLVAQHLYVTYVPATFFPELATQYPIEGSGTLYGPLQTQNPKQE